MASPIVCLDMAGTVVNDGGSVQDAFTQALSAVAEPTTDEITNYIQATMGQSKIEVFTALLGDEQQAKLATEAFDEAYLAGVAAGSASLIPGARQALERLRDAECLICLTTGFSPRIRRALIDKLELGDQIDVSLSPADAFGRRGRPAPDMLLTALIQLSGSSVRDLVVCGDTASDIRTGRNAGAGLLVGVLTGAHSRSELIAERPDLIAESVADLPVAVDEWMRVRGEIDA